MTFLTAEGSCHRAAVKVQFSGRRRKSDEFLRCLRFLISSQQYQHDQGTDSYNDSKTFVGHRSPLSIRWLTPDGSSGAGRGGCAQHLLVIRFVARDDILGTIIFACVDARLLAHGASAVGK